MPAAGAPHGPAATESAAAAAPAAVSAAAAEPAAAEPAAPAAVPGAALLDAVAVMHRLRSPGGCPWDAEQTHASLRRYLVEETYELLDAIGDDGAAPDRAALREELGDVLLQVLFHARVAAEHPTDAFDVDDVARGLVDKLVGRHPHVFAGSEHVTTATEQNARWETLKRAEKQRDSAVDGVALGQPAVALAAKLVSRATRAGLPADLLPGATRAPAGNGTAATGGTASTGGTPTNGGAVASGGTGERLFAAAAAATLDGGDPEQELRETALAFAARVRAAETAARAAGLDPAHLSPEQWRAHFPH